MLNEKIYTSVRMVFLSNLIESKGIFVLLNALHLLKEKGYNFICDIIGGETSEITAPTLYRKIEEEELIDVVFYKGRMTGEDKNIELRNAHLLIHPTKEDCFPLVLLEAMQQGLPCISTSEGAIRDIIDDGVTGLICEKNSPQDLADKIEILLLNPEMRKNMGRAGREKYEREFTIERFEKRMVDILKKLTC